jgi:Zn-finger nucleic acid-binding protein
MKKCPVCRIDLLHTDYEGFRVMQCGQCGGHLVPLQRFESIKRVGRKTQDELKAEASSDFTASSLGTLKCPRCHMSMRKQTTDLPVLDLRTDVCPGCALVWLDGGELALLQLGYQAKSKFINAQEFKHRMQELEASPERKARFERNLARLPDAADPLQQALGETGAELLGALLRTRL